MLKVAIVGCGKIADQHVHALARIPDCQIIALCDQELRMARQLGERFRISQCFSSVQDMFRAATPDVVHITTPPQSHFSLARQCLASGSHVYIEKPFTVTAEEAESLISFAQKAGLRITAGHNYQFTPEMIEMRRLVSQGFLGGKPFHLESHWTYDLGDTSYVGPILGNRMHWVRQLPGQLFHNVISHGIAKLVEFLDDDVIDIVARAHQSLHLRALGGQDVLDELRVLIRDRSGTTAFFFFSTQIKPGLTQLRVCGPRNSVIADYLTGSLIRHTSQPSKSYLTYFVPPIQNAREHLRSARLNLTKFLTRRLYQDSGMKELIDRFYQTIRNGNPTPIPYREILLTARIMDEIFTQINSRSNSRKTVTEAPREPLIRQDLSSVP
jgi:predicted dehydrogenase